MEKSCVGGKRPGTGTSSAGLLVNESVSDTEDEEHTFAIGI